MKTQKDRPTLLLDIVSKGLVLFFTKKKPFSFQMMPSIYAIASTISNWKSNAVKEAGATK